MNLVTSEALIIEWFVTIGWYGKSKLEKQE